jgi:aldehyde:ferredoxin oxidoreductase
VTETAGACGWAGEIIWVDLSKREVTKRPTSEFEPEKYIGGVGLGTRIFWELGCPDVDAFHPDSPLLVSVGPLTGSSGPFSRAEVCGIAPQSYPRELFAYSGFGGKFPSELKYAGYDAIVVVGKADKPAYIVVNDGEIAIRDASHLWGVDTFATQEALIGDHPKASAMTIGPAGENLSRIAVILNETASSAGQGGYGAVMGSKNLKAIVVRGTGTQRVARPRELLELLEERRKAGEWAAGPYQTWGRYPLCGEPIRSEMEQKYLKKFSGCYGCPYQCQGFYDMPGIGKGGQMCTEAWYGWFSGGSSEGMWEGNILSQKLGINNAELIGLMIFVWEGVARGILRREDLGLSSIPQIDNSTAPKFGGQEAHHTFLTELLQGIAGGSSPFSQGVARAAEQLGPQAIDLYNSIFPAYGYRNHHIEGVGAALHWATDTRDPFNSCHDYTTSFGRDADVAAHFGLAGGYLNGPDRKNVYERAEHETVWVQHHQCLKNSLPICEWASMPSLFFHPPAMDLRIFESRLFSAITGIDASADELWRAGERIWNLRRAIMVLRENRRREDDTLSQPWFERIVGSGDEVLPEPLDREQWEAVKDRYYALCGWSVDTGRPSRAKLGELGMKEMADTLQSAGRLG